MAPRIGILALQGDVEKHAGHLTALGARVRRVLAPKDLDDLDGIVLPGGESTTMSRLLRTGDLFEPLGRFMRIKPVLATCAGVILLAREADALPYETYGLLDLSVSRNAWGRQIHSFQAEIAWPLPAANGGAAGNSFRAIFIRAPRITRCGEGVEVLASFQGEPVAVRQDRILALTFHPELTPDLRAHRWFLESCL